MEVTITTHIPIDLMDIQWGRKRKRGKEKKMKESIIDIHCHILPGIDDGAQTVEHSLELINASLRNGVTEFVFTPHFYSERMTAEEFIDRRKVAEQILRSALQRKEMNPIRFKVGSEIAFTPLLAEMPLDKLCIAGTNYLLLELQPLFQPLDVEGLIKRLRNKGYIPILAHIERFQYIENEPLLLYSWIKAGALAQVNAGWVLKDRRALKRVEQYFKWNLIHLMASDTHSVEERPPNLCEGYQRLPIKITSIFKQNASDIFSNRELRLSTPIKPVSRFGHWC